MHCPISCRVLDGSDQDHRKQCTDVHPKCSDWAKEGDCDATRNIGTLCAKSCNNCVGKHRRLIDAPESSCVDIHDTSGCKFWAEAGECEKNPTVS